MYRVYSKNALEIAPAFIDDEIFVITVCFSKRLPMMITKKITKNQNKISTENLKEYHSYLVLFHLLSREWTTRKQMFYGKICFKKKTQNK